MQSRDIFSIFFNFEIYCVFALESPHRGDSNEYTQYTIFTIKTKITQNYNKSAAMEFFQGTQERVRNSRGRRSHKCSSHWSSTVLQEKQLCHFYFPYESILPRKISFRRSKFSPLIIHAGTISEGLLHLVNSMSKLFLFN